MRLLNPEPERLPGSGRILVAFSGGADSLCLLHQLATRTLARELACIHVDHQLDNESGVRAQQAKNLADQLSVSCTVITVDARGAGGPEAAARNARYRALIQHMAEGDVLLTAHHADDQAETVLLRLLRGASPAGLGGMPRSRPLGPGWLARPLLDWQRVEIDDYLARHQLEPVLDPSNLETGYDRNYIRRQVLPLIRQRWPGAGQAILRSAGLSREASEALSELAQIDLSQSRDEQDRLRLDALLQLSTFRLANALRHWCLEHGLEPPPPDRLQAFLGQIDQAAEDRTPELRWDQASLRRWRNRLWLQRGDCAVPDQWNLEWTGEKPVQLPGNLGTLELTGDAALTHRVEVGSGQEGERLRLPGQAHHQRVKQIMADYGVPPWQRMHWPRIRRNGRLLAVADQWLDAEFAQELEALGSRLVWRQEPSNRVTLNS